MAARDFYPASLIGGGKKRSKNTTIAVSNRRTRSSRGSPMQEHSLEVIAAEEKNIADELITLGLEARDVEGDGNCFFRAMSDQVYGDATHHPEIRKAVCDYLVAHREEWAMWVELDERFVNRKQPAVDKFAHYVQVMRQHGTYAGELEVIIAGRAYGKTFRIVGEAHTQTIEPEQPTNQDSEQPRRRTRSAGGLKVAPFVPEAEEGKDFVWLALFGKAEHYKSIRRKGDTSAGPAAIDNALALIPHHLDTSESAQAARAALNQAPPIVPLTPSKAKANRAAKRSDKKTAPVTAANPEKPTTPEPRLTPPLELATPVLRPTMSSTSLATCDKLYAVLGMGFHDGDWAEEHSGDDYLKKTKHKTEAMIASRMGYQVSIPPEAWAKYIATKDAAALVRLIQQQWTFVDGLKSARSSISSTERVEDIVAHTPPSSSSNDSAQANLNSDVSMEPASPNTNSTAPTEADSPGSSVGTKSSRHSRSTRGSSMSERAPRPKPYDRPKISKLAGVAQREALTRGLADLQVASRRSSGASTDAEHRTAIRHLEAARLKKSKEHTASGGRPIKRTQP